MIYFSLSYIFNLFTVLSTILSLQLLLHLEYLTVLRSQNLLSLKTIFPSIFFSDSFKLLLPRISSSKISYFLYTVIIDTLLQLVFTLFTALLFFK